MHVKPWKRQRKLSKELLSEKKGKKPVSVCQSMLGTRSSLLVTLQCSEEKIVRFGEGCDHQTILRMHDGTVAELKK